MPLTEETRLAAKQVIARYPRPRSALLPLLHLVQSEEGYVSPEGVRFCAEELGLTKAEVGAVATFYTMYKRRPAGEYLVSVCTNTLCDVLGGEEIYRTLSESLGVGHDETTADGLITLEHAECLAACDYAPVVTVNYEFFDQQTTGSASALVSQLQAGQRPLPTRGAPLCSFREISRQLAGFMDEREGALDAGPAGEPTLVGNRLAVQRGETAPPYDRPTPLDRPTRSPAAAPAGTGPASPPAPPPRRATRRRPPRPGRRRPAVPGSGRRSGRAPASGPAARGPRRTTRRSGRPPPAPRGTAARPASRPAAAARAAPGSRRRRPIRTRALAAA